MTTFEIRPQGPFSLAQAISFGFGPTSGADGTEPLLRLAFCVDGYAELAGVVVREDKEGSLLGSVFGAKNGDAVERQVARVLSLDFDANGWQEVGARDQVIGSRRARFVRARHRA